MKKFLLKTFLLLLALVAGTSVSRADTTTTYTFTSKSWEATSGGSAANWTSGQDGYGYSDGVQVSTSVSGANATSPSSFTNVSQIVVHYHTNASKGVGTIKVKVGTGTEQTFSVTKPASGTGTTSKSNTFSFSNETGNVKLTVECTTNSVYIESIDITYNDGGGSSAEATTTTIDYSDITNTNKFVGTAAGSLSATVTNSSDDEIVGAAVTWSGNNDAVATINASTGAVTLVGAGTVTFTASYAGVADTYQSSSDTYEMTVTNEDPSFVTIWSENFSGYDAGDAPTGAGYDYDDGGGTTKIYTEALAGGTSPELLVAKSNGIFAATITLSNATKAYTGDLTLTYKTNANTLNVKSGTTGITVDGEVSEGEGVTYSDAGTHTITFKGTTTNNTELQIIFTNTGSKNVRLDDIVLKGKPVDITTITLGDAGFATYANHDVDLDFSSVTGLTAMRATVSGDVVTFNTVGKVPAGTGLLLKGAEATYNVPVVDDATSIGDNLLVAPTTAVSGLNFNTTGYNNYILAKPAGKAVGFYRANNSNVAVGKAYLHVPEGSVRAMDFISFDGDETAISGVEANVAKANEIYNLAGQRVAKAQKGLYIVNGRKVVIK